MRVLVVDDEPLIASGIVYMINKMDIDCKAVDFAVSGVDALNKLNDSSFDILFSDIFMPDMDGLQLILECKEKRLCRSFCIISGHADFEYARQALRLGVKDYLLKPIDKEELFAVLQRFSLSIGIKKSMKAESNPYVQAVLTMITERYKEDISLNDAAGQISLNAEYCGKLFKGCVGLSFSEYLNRYRLNKILEIMREKPNLSFEEQAVLNGFSDIRNFYRVFKKLFNMTPGEYRRSYLENLH